MCSGEVKKKLGSGEKEWVSRQLQISKILF